MINVVMQSEEFGCEEFPRETWEEAFETIRNLTNTANAQNDGVERFVGIIVPCT